MRAKRLDTMPIALYTSHYTVGGSRVPAAVSLTPQLEQNNKSFTLRAITQSAYTVIIK